MLALADWCTNKDLEMLNFVKLESQSENYVVLPVHGFENLKEQNKNVKFSDFQA